MTLRDLTQDVPWAEECSPVGPKISKEPLHKKPDGGGLFELREIPFPALATTGSYAFSEDGANLDLVDSANDGPVSSDISITVFAESCILADAMTKTVLNLQTDRAADLLKKYHCCALILESGGRFREL